jgi:gluconate 2-dehydrogenase gamma chain
MRGDLVMTEVSRRTMLTASAAIGATVLPAGLPSGSPDEGAPICSAEAAERPTAGATAKPSDASARHQAPRTTYLFFNKEESAFIEAAVARLIPADEEWPGALEAGVPNYIDKQLGGAWGAGERLYRSGPWQQGTPSQGYQLPFTPAELFHTALAAINKARAGTPFAKASAEEQHAYLKKLEAGGVDLGGVPSDVFFAQLWELTLEGFFSDPVYGGNRDMVGWRMIGFPGAYASFYDLVDKHGIKLDRPPVSLAEDAYGHIHMNPEIPAYSPPNNR